MDARGIFKRQLNDHSTGLSYTPSSTRVQNIYFNMTSIAVMASRLEKCLICEDKLACDKAKMLVARTRSIGSWYARSLTAYKNMWRDWHNSWSARLYSCYCYRDGSCFKVIVGHIFEISIKCSCFIRSQWNFVCMLRLSGHNLINLEGKYIFSKHFIQTCVNFWPINSKNEKYTSYTIWGI